jgi:hypothetical protein
MEKLEQLESKFQVSISTDSNLDWIRSKLFLLNAKKEYDKKMAARTLGL